MHVPGLIVNYSWVHIFPNNFFFLHNFLAICYKLVLLLKWLSFCNAIMNTLYGSILKKHPFSSNFTFKIKSHFHRVLLKTPAVKWDACQFVTVVWVSYFSCHVSRHKLFNNRAPHHLQHLALAPIVTSTACSPVLPDITVILLPPSFDGVLNGSSLRDPLPLCHTVPSQAGFSLAQSRWQIVIIISQSPKLSGVRAVWSLSLNLPSERH